MFKKHIYYYYYYYYYCKAYERVVEMMKADTNISSDLIQNRIIIIIIIIIITIITIIRISIIYNSSSASAKKNFGTPRTHTSRGHRIVLLPGECQQNDNVCE